VRTLQQIAAAAGDQDRIDDRLEELVAYAQRVDPVLHGFISLAEPGGGAPVAMPGRGALDGVALAVKDNVDVSGFTTTCGSAFYRADPTTDAPPVAALRAAGARVVGKANLGEFAIDSTCQNEHFGGASNPWDPARITGGSSGGSAAVLAAGLADLAIGTDAAGSVRIPASFCGVAGFRPGGGAWGTAGIAGAAWSIDSIGVMARTAEDVAYAVIASGLLAPRADCSRATPRVAYLADESMGVAASHVWEQYQRAIDALVASGCDLIPVSLNGIGEALGSLAVIGFSELASCHQEWLAGDFAYGAGIREPLEVGSAFRAVEYFAAQRARAEITERVERALEGFTFLLTPTMPVTAPLKGEAPEVVGDADTLFTLIRFTALANLTTAPSMSVFGGCASDGLPIGLQVMGRVGDDRGVLALACDIDAAMDQAFATRRRLQEVLISWS
jgi:aspartyl-tRNA(Asn)/glutamyl-tRNA(Gln) amidotransferase subunit A